MTQSASKSAQRDLTALTGLRFVAAIAVVLYHFAKIPLPSWATPLKNFIDSGYVGVSLFFLLSGFIMSYSYLPLRDGRLRGTKRAFYVSRFARIVPAYLLAFLLAAPTDISLSLHANGLRTGLLKLCVSALTVLTFTQAWTPITAWAWNFPAWSVSVEAFFYAVFPFLGPWLLRRKGHRLKTAAYLWLLSLLAPLALYLLKGPTGPPKVGDYLQMAVEFTPLLRLPEFALGILLGNAFVAGKFDRFSSAWLSPVAAALVVAAMVVAPYLPHPLVADFLFTPLFALLIVSLALGKGPLAAVLSTSGMVLLGEASYGIYILQIPVSYVLRRPPPLTRPFVLLGYCIALVAIALVSLRFVETPLRNDLRRRFSGPSTDRSARAAIAGDTGGDQKAALLHTQHAEADAPVSTTRRQVLVAGVAAAGIATTYAAARRLRWGPMGRPVQPALVEWISTTQDSPWQRGSLEATDSWWHGHDFTVRMDAPAQTIDGFGGCFNELGWEALAALPEQDRRHILQEFFAPGVGANFTICRTPLGANDFSRGWYSYDETNEDFSLEHFSVAHDAETLIPFLKAAQEHHPDLRLWASPWSPPSWMKRNNFYAEQAQPDDEPSNGIRPEQIVANGTDNFRGEERYYEAYAEYFGRYIDAYKAQGIAVSMVMPQNEFSSAQPFPSCTWSPETLARFIQHLGPRMTQRGVDIFLGTLEVGNPALLEPALQDESSSRYVRGVGVQWAGKTALPALHKAYPQLQIYQSEQECGDGENDWRHCLHCWDLMKFYLENGANAYMYWNLALDQDAVSHWGWKQNSLVTVDTEQHTYRFNHEYYLLKHFSHFVQPGARRLQTEAHVVEGLAFANTDGGVVVVIRNTINVRRPVNIVIGDARVSAWLKPNSFNTFLIHPSAFGSNHA